MFYYPSKLLFQGFYLAKITLKVLWLSSPNVFVLFFLSQAAGKYKQEGKNYVVNDGDIIFFKFNAGAGLTDKKKAK